ncbi:unnamed protein product [Aureobasidium mustum]|uniref:Myb-like domain-containing protein n=1 Tax=Aureobasidium mustum TaxID=2773714 RepID=A0A9N8JLC8_9PEZI|nr:unnamed protein product [Aureobasidium mustum]
MDKRTILLQAGIDTPAKFFEVYGWYDNLDTGLGEGFNFDNPLEPSPSTARTGSQATMAHRGDWNSLLEGAEGYDSLAHSFTDGGEAFWLKCVKPVLDAEKPPVELGWGQELEYSDLEEEVSEEEEETDSEEDRRPARSAWKRPVGNTAGSVEGQGEWPSSDGVPLADAPEWQQDEDDEEFEGDDDEYGRPARLSVAPAPTISSRKASAWSEDEDAACIKLMKEVCTLAQYAAIAGTEKRFEVVANRMKDEAGFNRTASGVKLQWNRRLRAASGFEDRGEKKRASGLTTSALSQGIKRGTSAATSSVSSNPARGKKSSATSAQSTETGSLSGRQGKRKAIHVDSDDEDDDDFSAPRLYPAKRPRTAAASSSSTLPSTQDVAYYDLSAANILSGPRSTRHRPATTTTIATTTSDDEEEAIPPSITPEPDHNSLAYWQDVLRQRQAKLAKQREEAERQQENEEKSEDEEPVITTADRARKARERRKQKTSPTTKSASTTRSSSTTRSFSATRPASITRPTSTTTSSSTTGRGLSYSEYLRQGLGHIPPPHPSTTRSSARRFNLSPIVEDAEPTTVHTTPAAAAQIAADEEIARRMQEEWNEAPAPRSRRGRGFR